jgi:LPS sulfotransferase NodH
MQQLKANLESLETNVHIVNISDHFGGDPGKGDRLVDEVLATDMIFICFTNRCGSNYLAELLASGGHFNLGGEIYNHTNVTKYCAKHEIKSMAGYLNHIILARRRNDCFISKISVSQLYFLNKLGLLDGFQSNVSYILLERGNKIAQAVSYMIARQTKQWASHQRPKTSVDPVFKPQLALNFLEVVCRSHALFDAFFAVKGITPILTSYETLVSRPVETVAGLLADCGVQGIAVDRSKVRTKRQADPTNEAFEKELRRCIAALG